VRHKPVEVAIRWFVNNFPNYRRVYVEQKAGRFALRYHKGELYDKYTKVTKKTYNNPPTMFAFVKNHGLEFNTYNRNSYIPDINKDLFILHSSIHLPYVVLRNKDQFVQECMNIKSLSMITDEANNWVECFDDMIPTKITTCVNVIVRKMMDLYKSYLKEQKEDLCMFVLLTCIYINKLINIDICIPNNSEFEELKELLRNIKENLIPYMIKLISVIIHVIIHPHDSIFINDLVSILRMIDYPKMLVGEPKVVRQMKLKDRKALNTGR